MSPNGGVEPVWARDGRELFYLEGNKLMAARIVAGQTFSVATPELLFESAHMHDGQPPTYDVSADGRFIMIKSSGTVEPFTQPFTVVINWIDELERRIGAR